MDAVTTLSEINWIYVCGAIIAAIVAAKYISDALEWLLIEKLGIETKRQRKRREEHELLIATNKGLVELRKKHEEDNEKSIKDDNLIKEELTEFIKYTRENDEKRDKQIESLVTANKEILADKIDQKYNKYITLKGIPANEVDDFKNLHDAYNGCKGNHNGDAKYEYVINHLPVIPVETKIVM